MFKIMMICKDSPAGKEYIYFPPNKQFDSFDQARDAVIEMVDKEVEELKSKTENCLFFCGDCDGEYDGVVRGYEFDPSTTETDCDYYIITRYIILKI